MRILQVNKFHYNRGGAETVYFGVSDLLRKHGHEVIPFAMQDPRNEPTSYDRYFVSNIDLREESGGIAGKIGAAARILYSREAEQRIDRLIRDTKPDIAHLHNIYHQLSPSILRALKRHSVPVVMTLHDYQLICPAYTLYTDGSVCEQCRGHRYYNTVLRSCVKGSRLKSAICAVEAYFHAATGMYRNGVKYYIAPSRFLSEKMVEFGLNPRQVTYVPNFIDAAPMAVQPVVGSYYLYAGRLENVKGVGTLLRAVAASPAARAHELRIAGDGEQRAELEAYCHREGLENVRFLGHLSQEQMGPLLEDASFVVVPSEWYENAPLSVLEAAARGKAVVVSDLGGLPELVKDGETGVIFKAGDSGALRLAIDGLLADPERASVMGRQARAFMQEEFDPELHYRRLLAIYERALAPSSIAV